MSYSQSPFAPTPDSVNLGQIYIGDPEIFGYMYEWYTPDAAPAPAAAAVSPAAVSATAATATPSVSSLSAAPEEEEEKKQQAGGDLGLTGMLAPSPTTDPAAPISPIAPAPSQYAQDDASIANPDATPAQVAAQAAAAPPPPPPAPTGPHVPTIQEYMAQRLASNPYDWVAANFAANPVAQWQGQDQYDIAMASVPGSEMLSDLRWNQLTRSAGGNSDSTDVMSGVDYRGYAGYQDRYSGSDLVSQGVANGVLDFEAFRNAPGSMNAATEEDPMAAYEQYKVQVMQERAKSDPTLARRATSGIAFLYGHAPIPVSEDRDPLTGKRSNAVYAPNIWMMESPVKLPPELVQYLDQQLGSDWDVGLADAIKGAEMFTGQHRGAKGAQYQNQAGALASYLSQTGDPAAMEYAKQISSPEAMAGLSRAADQQNKAQTMNEWAQGVSAASIMLGPVTAGAAQMLAPAIAAAMPALGMVAAQAAAQAAVQAVMGALKGLVPGGPGLLQGAVGGGGAGLFTALMSVVPGFASMAPSVQQAIASASYELIMSEMQNRDVNWMTMGQSALSGVAGAGAGDANGQWDVLPDAVNATGTPELRQAPDMTGMLATSGQPSWSEQMQLFANNPEAMNTALQTGDAGTVASQLGLGGEYQAAPETFSGIDSGAFLGQPAAPAMDVAPEGAPEEEGKINWKTVASLAQGGLKLLSQFMGGSEEPADAPRQEEGETQEEYQQQLVEYLKLTPPEGVAPDSEEFAQWLESETNRVISEVLGQDADFLQGATPEQLSQMLSGKREEELLQLQRALFVRGQMGTLSAKSQAVNPFTGKTEQLGFSGMLAPDVAAYQQGLRGETEQLGSLRGTDARTFLEGLANRKVDLYGMQGRQNAAKLAEMLEGDEEKRRRLRQGGAGAQEALGAYSDTQLNQILSQIGDEEAQAAAIAELFGQR